MIMIIPVQSHYHEGSSSEVKVGKICWKSWSERGKEWCMIKVPLNVTPYGTQFLQLQWDPAFPTRLISQNARRPTVTCWGDQSWCTVQSPLIFHFNNWRWEWRWWSCCVEIILICPSYITFICPLGSIYMLVRPSCYSRLVSKLGLFCRQILLSRFLCRCVVRDALTMVAPLSLMYSLLDRLQ